MQQRLKLSGAIDTGPSLRQCFSCDQSTHRRCRWCGVAVCGRHVFVVQGEDFCWAHALDAHFGPEEVSGHERKHSSAQAERNAQNIRGGRKGVEAVPAMQSLIRWA